MWGLLAFSLAAAGLWLGADFSATSAQVKGEDLGTKTTDLGGGTTFPANPATLGSIPDGPGVPTTCGPNGSPLDVEFPVMGLSGAPINVEVDMNATHSWVTDVSATLIAPTGEEHVVFARTRATTDTSCGDSSDLSGVYNFLDNCPGCTNWWDEAFNNTVLTPGDYRTTEAGGAGQVDPAPETVMTDAFNGIADPNGTWTLRVVDGGSGDTGSISDANLTIEAGSTAGPGSTHVDIDGDGTTDYLQARDETSPLRGAVTPMLSGAKSYRERIELLRDREIETPDSLGPPQPGSSLSWWGLDSSSGTPNLAAFGDGMNDFVVPADFDGDGKADFATWRPIGTGGPSGNAYFFVMQSSDSTVNTIDFGQMGDDPTVSGDYDGDGMADPAVFRCPSTAGQCTYFYLGSAGSGTTFVPWGFGTPFSQFANPGDFDGDGKHDFCLQRTNPNAPSGGQFTLLRSSDFGVEYVNWGNNTDLIAPGDYDGDGTSDYAIARNQAGQRTWYVLSSDASTILYYAVPFGLGTDTLTPGDYDGDGSQDIGVFRPDADPDQNFFYSLRSSDLGVTSFEWGQQGDYPVANWQVH